jgi:hypothetical protein
MENIKKNTKKLAISSTIENYFIENEMNYEKILFENIDLNEVFYKLQFLLLLVYK